MKSIASGKFRDIANDILPPSATSLRAHDRIRGTPTPNQDYS